jgi:LuxR family maltose regulon positive regulatory protein
MQRKATRPTAALEVPEPRAGLHPRTGLDRPIADKHPPILATKIIPPRMAPGLIYRGRLLGLIDQVQAKGLTVVRAAAGFGKTSLAGAWAERLRQMGRSVAWLSLDADDDEPTRFLFYVAHVLRRSCNGLGEPAISLIQEIFLARPNTIVSMLINDLAEIDDEVYLFLDDYHWVTHRGIHDGIAFLLRNAPSNFHLVIATRSEPPLPLGRLQAQNQLLQVDVSALRFDLDETREFLEQGGLHRLDPTDLKTLHAKTEGWPAVMRIVVSTSWQSGQELGQYVRQLTGAVRPIGTYLSEMLDGLPDEMVQFMLRTAILDRLTAPLCQAVTGTRSSQQMLDMIVDRQLLLTPLDHEGQWCQFHPLLRDHLLKVLDARLGDEVPELHRRAYRWYASRELWTDAVQHATAVGDTAQALFWIEDCAMVLVKRGDLLPLLVWQRLLPSELMCGQAKVRMAIAWGMALAMRFGEALQMLQDLEPDIGSDDTPTIQLIRCECQTIRAVVVALQDDSETALALAEATMRQQPADPWIANVASNVARFGYWKGGDFAAFHATPWMPCSDDESRRNVFATVYRLCIQGLVELQQLRFSEAERFYLEALRGAEQHAGPNSAAAALPASLIAQIRYDQGRLDEAEELVTDRLPVIDAAGMLECVLRVYLILARIAVRRTNVERAHAVLEQAEALGRGRGWDRLIAVAQAERIGLHAAAGRMKDLGTGLARLERLLSDQASKRAVQPDIRYYTELARAHAASAEGRLTDCIAILGAQRDVAIREQRDYFALRLATPLAVVQWRAGDPASAMHLFTEALGLAGPAGMYQLILDAGPEILALLVRCRDGVGTGGISRELLPYAEVLIDRCREAYPSEPTQRRASLIAEALSPREGKVLELLGVGQSNKDIARTLSIAPETVKSHVKNIFVKLSVERRSQAVARALSLGLIRTP